jgi:hypothetical protein
MPEVAFIVEGQLEQRVIQLVCPGKKVVLLGANGDDVKAATICDRIATQFRLFSNRYFPIIVILDREKRAQTCAEFEAELQTELSGRGIDPTQFLFLISDRDFECLFVAHLTLEGEFVATGCPITKDIDGIDGESEVRLRLSNRGVRYHKTTTGVDLFKKIRPSIISKKSANFRKFQSQIVTFCTWAAL